MKILSIILFFSLVACTVSEIKEAKPEKAESKPEKIVEASAKAIRHSARYNHVDNEFYFTCGKTSPTCYVKIIDVDCKDADDLSRNKASACKYKLFGEEIINPGEEVEFSGLPKRFKVCRSAKVIDDIVGCKGRIMPRVSSKKFDGPIQVADPDFKPHIDNPRFSAGDQKSPIVRIDEAHGNFHTLEGRYAPLANLLKADGYRVEKNTQAFSVAALKNTDVLLIANAMNRRDKEHVSAFTLEEIEAVKNWVNGGGSLLLIIDHPPFDVGSEALAKALGFELLKKAVMLPGFNRFSRETETLLSHPITDAKSRTISFYKTFSGTGFKAPKTAEHLLKFPLEKAKKFSREDGPATLEDGWSPAAVMKYGKGRIAFFAEAGAFSAQVIRTRNIKMGMGHPQASENAQFTLNVMRWLTP